VSLNGTPLISYSGVTSAEACCQLCLSFTSGSCTAFTIKQGACFLFKDLSYMAVEDGAITGYSASAKTHYQDPSTVGCAAADEIANTVPAIEGSFCSAPCENDNAWCPPDKPAGVSATPKCMVKDPVGTGMHCALSCKSDSDCGAIGKCSTAYGPANGMCVGARDEAPGEMRIFANDTCPPGWVEAEVTKGYVLVSRPKDSSAGVVLNSPLANGERARVGPHTHEVTVTDPGHGHDINDPGHSHQQGAGSSRSGYSGGGTWIDSTGNWNTGTATTGIGINNVKTSIGVSIDVTKSEGYPLLYVLLCRRSAIL